MSRWLTFQVYFHNYYDTAVGTRYISISAYQASREDELSFVRGAVVRVQKKFVDGWWLVRSVKEQYSKVHTHFSNLAHILSFWKARKAWGRGYIDMEFLNFAGIMVGRDLFLVLCSVSSTSGKLLSMSRKYVIIIMQRLIVELMSPIVID